MVTRKRLSPAFGRKFILVNMLSCIKYSANLALPSLFLMQLKQRSQSCIEPIWKHLELLACSALVLVAYKKLAFSYGITI